MHCPSSPDKNISTFQLPLQPGLTPEPGSIEFPVEMARSQYVGCIGSVESVSSIQYGTCPAQYNPSVGDINQNGIFYGNSKTRHTDILDGSSNTILVGERSAYQVSESTWTGVVAGAEFARWRVVGWTGEPPNYKPSDDPTAIHFHAYAQFNSAHLGRLTMFAYADGSVKALSADIDFDLFHSLGTIRGRETIAKN